MVKSDDGKNPEIEWMAVPRVQLKSGNEYWILRLTGDSMARFFSPEALLLVNFSRCNPKARIGKVVAAWMDNDGAIAKRLLETIKIVTEFCTQKILNAKTSGSRRKIRPFKSQL